MTEKIPGCVWTNEAVTLLLTLYLREKQKDHPVKLKKKEIWKYICAELWARGLLCSWQECDKKYRNLKQTFVRNLKQAGKKECRWMFFPIMLEINKHEPFVNEMVTNAFAHSSSNTSISDYDNDNENDDCSQEATDNNGIEQDHNHRPDNGKADDESIQYVPKSIQKPAVEIPDILLQNRMMIQHYPMLVHQQQQTFGNGNRPPLSKSPSPHRTLPPSPQHSPLSLTSSSSPRVNGHHYQQDSHAIFTERLLNHQQHLPHLEPLEPIPLKKTRRSIPTPEPDNEPPDWFTVFMVEFRKSEEKKMQTIQDLCTEVRRTNDIEHQRNLILNEKNVLLKNLMDLMNNPK